MSDRYQYRSESRPTKVTEWDFVVENLIYTGICRDEEKVIEATTRDDLVQRILNYCESTYGTPAFKIITDVTIVWDEDEGISAFAVKEDFNG